MQNFKIILAYDGQRYAGWQRLKDSDKTIQGKLETLLTRMDDTDIQVIGAGRTDAGVHALGQVANFHSATRRTPEQILEYLNTYLPNDISALSVAAVDDRFHSRFHAVSKVYRYTIHNCDQRDVFSRHYAYHISGSLDINAMKAAARLLVGTHDFASFTAYRGNKSTVRTISDIDIAKNGNFLTLTFTGDGFLYKMIRIITGTLIEIGQGITYNVDDCLASGIRAKVGATAPPHGLCLQEVIY